MTLAAPSVGDWTRPGGFLSQVPNMDQTLQGAQEQTSSWSIFRALLCLGKVLTSQNSCEGSVFAHF